jgi:hypothetical protein
MTGIVVINEMHRQLGTRLKLIFLLIESPHPPRKLFGVFVPGMHRKRFGRGNFIAATRQGIGVLPHHHNPSMRYVFHSLLRLRLQTIKHLTMLLKLYGP